MRAWALNLSLSIMLPAASLNCATVDKSSAPVIDATNTISLADEAAAIARAKRLTGLDRVFAKIAATKVAIFEDKTPFLSKQIVESDAWQVDFGPGKLVLKSHEPDLQDHYARTFSVFLDRRSGRLLSIKSRYSGAWEDMRPEPSAAAAEAQMAAAGDEKYTGFPTVDPKFDFLNAVNQSGMVCALLAKEIDASYVMDSEMGHPARAEWMITLRGIPPITPFGGYAKSVPDWQLNHIRNAVDAMSGEALFSTSVPQPD